MPGEEGKPHDHILKRGQKKEPEFLGIIEKGLGNGGESCSV